MVAAREQEELRPGLYSWTALHPEWKKDVRSVAWAAPDALTLIDPLAPSKLSEARRFWKSLDAWVRDLGTPVQVLLTLHYHRRSAPEVSARYDAPVWVPTGSDRRVRLAEPTVFDAPTRFPGGIEAFPSGRPGEVVFWIEGARGLVAGDVLLGAGGRQPFRICPSSWLPRSVTRADVAEALEPLRELPVELLVPLHGAVVRENAAAALAAALAGARAT